MKSSDEDMERMLVRFFLERSGLQLPLDVIFSEIGRPNGWRGSFFDVLSTDTEKAALSAIVERMARDGLLWAFESEDRTYELFMAAPKLAEHPRINYLFPRSAELKKINAAIASTDWTGLATGATGQKIAEIKRKASVLQAAIIQSDTDHPTKLEACKRVEAVVVLLDAPNVPWREVVNLLNHPSVTAFMMALNLIQFIIGVVN